MSGCQLEARLKTGSVSTAPVEVNPLDEEEEEEGMEEENMDAEPQINGVEEAADILPGPSYPTTQPSDEEQAGLDMMIFFFDHKNNQKNDMNVSALQFLVKGRGVIEHH